MVFRVSNAANDLQFLMHNRRARFEESSVLEHLSTMKKVNRASDNPEHYNRIANTKIDLSETRTFKDSIASALSTFQITEDALGGVRDAIAEARSITLRGTSHLHDPLERETIADQIGQLRLSIMNRLNTRNEGNYIFSGTLTSTEPFQDPVTGNYSGNTTAVDVRVSQTDTVQINFNGEEIAFGPGGQGSADDILDALSDIETAYRTNNLAAVATEMTRLEPALERVNNIISEVGVRAQRLIMEQGHYETFETELLTTLSQLEDADLAEEALNLEQAQNTIQAQLRSQGTVNRQSLLDFLS